MRLALLSDIHANLQAFEACVAHARKQAVSQWAVLGDSVGYGGNPSAVLQRVMQMAEQGAWLVKGNHDAMAVAPPEKVETIGESTAQWTHDQLSAEELRFCDQLPLTCLQGDVLLVHASADAPAAWNYIHDVGGAQRSLDAVRDSPEPGMQEVRYVLGGHVHHQMLYYTGAGAALMPFAPTPGVAVPVPRHRRWLATVGSVGQPRDGNALAMYAVLDTVQSQIMFQRVPYDLDGAAAAIRRAGLPDFFADRLSVGR